jgi:hypothetical protein
MLSGDRKRIVATNACFESKGHRARFWTANCWMARSAVGENRSTVGRLIPIRSLASTSVKRNTAARMPFGASLACSSELEKH